MTEYQDKYDVVIIGAGPAGSLAATMLAQRGVNVLVIEKSGFPRFVIGESLLPQSMVYLEKAGILGAVKDADFQTKNGANFSDDTRFSSIDFSDKFTEGWSSTYQVQREKFDSLLAREAEKAGAKIWFENTVLDVQFDSEIVSIKGCGQQGEYLIKCRFVVDASGYGRVLPRLLNLGLPSTFPVRHALFTHVDDSLDRQDFDREKILITVHPKHSDIWFWLIPFSEGVSSVGVVCSAEHMARYHGSASDKLWALIGETTQLNDYLKGATERRPVSELSGYSSNVSRMCNSQFALLGNAGEFLDPVFSSGVTIAFKSADLLIDPLMRQLSGEDVDWEQDFAAPLKVGVDCFRAFVEAWYDGELQTILFNPPPYDNPIKKMIVSILAGYAWDEKNPFVKQGRRYIDLLAAQCA
ncbi:NAD(P)/FAD-dependent oxidoreductase [Sneathiella marina]|uniref:NAD(P)/FAD-dependent oxidoreductase n=1 Tax=Sneathiella marina TaxID=2950108 RepID=A0ABY4W616_9PROT|nr:NAD(P)/FAD-dependent oxidoreductase [Sneathiella marina]USG62622.1 NAD(P)/FAD-dependent oxidoreductase [Sneathiella marina]